MPGSHSRSRLGGGVGRLSAPGVTDWLSSSGRRGAGGYADAFLFAFPRAGGGDRSRRLAQERQRSIQCSAQSVC